MLRPLFVTLRARLLLLVLAAALPALGLILSMELQARRSQIRVGQDRATRLAHLVATRQELFVERTRQLLATLVLAPDLRALQPEQCARRLEELRLASPWGTSLWVAGPDGRVVCGASADPVPASVAGRDVFRWTMATQAFAAGEYELVQGTGRPVRWFGYPVLDRDGWPRAVVAAGLNQEWLESLVAAEKLPSGARLWILDEADRILATYPWDQARIGTALPEAPQVRAARSGGGEAAGKALELAGDPTLAAWAPLRGEPSGWGEVVVGIPAAAATVEVDRRLRNNLLGLSLATLAVGLLVWVGGDRFLLRPVRALLAATERMRAGDLSARAGLAAGPRELRGLGESFDAMAGSLEGELAARRRAEAAAVARSGELESLRAVTAEITRELDEAAVLDLIVRKSQAMVGADVAVLRIWDEAAQLLVAKSAHGAGGDALSKIGLRLGEGGAGAAAAARQGLIIDDIRSSPHALSSLLEAAPAVAILAEPLLYRERLVGTLILGREAGRAPFTPEDQRLLCLFAAQAAIAIENARLYEQVRAHAWELELTVTERTTALEQANRKLESASRAKSEFLADMSHELRTPLNGILGFTQLLREQNGSLPEEKRARYLDHIAGSGRHLLSLISDILDLSKIEAGKIELNPVPLPVAQTLEDLLVISRGLANPKGQRIELAVAPDLPALTADPVRFKQILFNLLSNAVKFTPAGGLVRLTARVIAEMPSEAAAGRRQPAGGEPDRPGPQLEIAYRKSKMIELVVSDTGAGIRAEDLPRLFQEFTQLESTAAHHQEGTGLGLALTRRLVELHGGRIWAESAGLGQGSTFTLVLPLEGAGHGQTD